MSKGSSKGHDQLGLAGVPRPYLPPDINIQSVDCNAHGAYLGKNTSAASLKQETNQYLAPPTAAWTTNKDVDHLDDAEGGSDDSYDENQTCKRRRISNNSYEHSPEQSLSSDQGSPPNAQAHISLFASSAYPQHPLVPGHGMLGYPAHYGSYASKTEGALSYT
jgi:hypothetical protein